MNDMRRGAQDGEKCVETCQSELAKAVVLDLLFLTSAHV